MPLPSISLITPTRNQAAFIERTIASVLAQETPPLEWIVLDAMSTDETPDILARYAHVPWLRVIREPDRGQSDAINKGLRLARGDFAGWLNSDDELLPGALGAVATALASYPGTALIYGAGRKISPTGDTLKRVRARAFDAALLRHAFYILQPAMFFRRDLALSLGGVDESLAYAMDWDLVLRLARSGDVRVIDAELAALRVYAETKSESGGWERFEEIARVGRRWNGALDRNHLACIVRRAASRLPLPGVRRVADFVLARLYPPGTVMVVGWPRE
jgi:glycosyltransferase involved in cell wall biosynthesis